MAHLKLEVITLGWWPFFVMLYPVRFLINYCCHLGYSSAIPHIAAKYDKISEKSKSGGEW